MTMARCVFRRAMATSARLKKELNTQLWFMSPDRSTIYPEIIKASIATGICSFLNVRVENFHHESAIKRGMTRLFVLETVAL